MENEDWKELEAFFGKGLMELPQLKSTLFGGLDPVSVHHYFDRLEEQTKEYLRSIQEKYELQLQTLTRRCEALELENQDCVDCLDRISQSMTTMSQSFLQLLRRQHQRDQLLRTYQRQLGSPGQEGGEECAFGSEREEPPLTSLPDPLLLSSFLAPEWGANQIK